jgi:CoA:oxalate CoA-transferase
MLEATLAFAWESNRDVVQRQRDAGHKVRRIAPWNSYPARDGRVMICAYTDRQWDALKDLIGLDDERFDDRLERIRLVEELDARVAEWTISRPKWEVAHLLQELGVPSSPVLQPLEVIESPQVRARGALRPVVHPRLGEVAAAAPEFPLWVDERHHVLYDRQAPELGQDNDALDELIARRGVPASARSVS